MPRAALDIRPRLHRWAIAFLLATGPVPAAAALVGDGEGDPAPKAVDPALAKMPALPPADLDDGLAIGGSDVDGRKSHTRMTVAVTINGQGPYRFVVDSGADTSVVGERVAAQLKLPPGRRAILNSTTDSRIVDRVLVDELGVGPTQVYDLQLPVLRERDLGAHGMLGLDALVEQRLMLDFEKNLITVDEGRSPQRRDTGEIVVTARLHKGQLILTQVRAGSQRLNAVVDTGSEISIGNMALRDKLLRRDPRKFREIEISSVTGTRTKIQIASIPELRLGSVVLRNVPIAFADIPPFAVFGIDAEPSLLLGTDLMSVFRKVSLDFYNRKVRFQLKRCNGVAIVSTSEFATRLIGSTPASCE